VADVGGGGARARRGARARARRRAALGRAARGAHAPRARRGGQARRLRERARRHPARALAGARRARDGLGGPRARARGASGGARGGRRPAALAAPGAAPAARGGRAAARPLVRRPEPGRPWRIAFVGQEHYFGVCSPRKPSRAIDPAFVDHRGGADAELMLARVRAYRPHVVIVFRPEIVPPGLFAGLDALTLGWNTEPLPRAGLPSHRDLDWRLTELLETDPFNFDRLISFEPVSAPSAEPRLRLWRSLPLPVADEVYAPLRPMGRPPRVAFVGYSTAHRERWLIEVKHRFDVLHLVHGVTGDRLL